MQFTVGQTVIHPNVGSRWPRRTSCRRASRPSWAEVAIAVTETSSTTEEVKQTAHVSNQKAKTVQETAQKAAAVSGSRFLLGKCMKQKMTKGISALHAARAAQALAAHGHPHGAAEFDAFRARFEVEVAA